MINDLSNNENKKMTQEETISLLKNHAKELKFDWFTFAILISFAFLIALFTWNCLHQAKTKRNFYELINSSKELKKTDN